MAVILGLFGYRRRRLARSNQAYINQTGNANTYGSRDGHGGGPPPPLIRLKMPTHMGAMMVTATDLPLPSIRLEMPTHLGTVMATAADLPLPDLPDRSTRRRFTILPTVGTDPTMGLALVRIFFSLARLLLMLPIRSPPLHLRSNTHRHPAHPQSGHRSKAKPVLLIYVTFLTALNSPRALGVRAHALVLCYPSSLKLSYFMRILYSLFIYL
jgi:hypothetical protein